MTRMRRRIEHLTTTKISKNSLYIHAEHLGHVVRRQVASRARDVSEERIKISHTRALQRLARAHQRVLERHLRALNIKRRHGVHIRHRPARRRRRRWRHRPSRASTTG